MEYLHGQALSHTPDESLSIIVPSFNEAATLREALLRLWSISYPLKTEIILVDDGSTDASWEIARLLKEESPLPLHLFRHERNRGKTAAIRTGLEAATGTLTLIYDADLEYDPGDIPALLAPILDGRADAVYGSRFLSPERRVLFFWHALGNRLVTALANMFANLNLTDMETCFKVIRTATLKEMRLRSERFGYEPEVTVKLGRLGQRIYEVPIRYSGRSYEEGKKIGWRDAIRAMGTILRAGLIETPVSTPESVTRFALSRLGPYYAELLGRIDPPPGDTVLEVASGAGEIARHLSQRTRLLLTDPRIEDVGRLKIEFSHRPNVEVAHWDPCAGPLGPQPERFDTVIAFHSLACLQDEGSALATMAAHLKPGGNMVLLLPANPSLYSSVDRGLGRSQRFTRSSVLSLLDGAGLKVGKITQVNFVGAIGWWLGRISSRSTQIHPWQVRIFRLFMPLVKLERLIPPPTGLSWLVTARHK
ncbi:glycosyltransferase [Candidatus Zixiibacteriota bacterium]